MIKRYLESSGIGIIEAVNGEEAVSLAKQYLPDLVLMDMKMPLIDGYEATRILKDDDDTKSIPIIALTASSMKSDETVIRRTG